jgi:hypothetical protein
MSENPLADSMLKVTFSTWILFFSRLGASIFLAAAFSCLLGLKGCSGSIDAVPTNSPTAVALDFEAQLAAVRAGTSDQISLEKQQITDSDLQRLHTDDPLRVFSCDAGVITDAGARKLSGLKSLEEIRLRFSPIGDSGIIDLLELPNLRVLNLPQSELTDQSLSAIAEANRIELLRFHSPHVTDAGLRVLLQSDRLRFLHLIDVGASDALIDDLIQSKQLESFYVDRSAITDSGFTRLFNARPDLHIHIDNAHHDLDQRAEH